MPDTLTPEQQALAANQNIPAGQAGSPWSVAPLATPALVTPAPFRYTTPTPTPVQAEVSGLDRTAPTAEEENTIREQARQSMQAYIDAVNAQYRGLVQEEQVRGANRAGETRAGSARAGLLGSSFGAQRATGTESFNKQQVASIEAQRSAELSKAYEKINEIADTKIAAEKAYAQKNQETYLNYQNQVQSQAQDTFKTIGEAGIDISQMDPQAWQDLVSNTGYSDQTAKLLINAYKPKPEQVDYQYITQADGSILAIGHDPKTGKLIRETIEGVSQDVGIVLEMIKNYKDAGILPTDSIEVATEKMKKSRIYAKDTYIAPESTPKTDVYGTLLQFGVQRRQKSDGGFDFIDIDTGQPISAVDAANKTRLTLNDILQGSGYQGDIDYTQNIKYKQTGSGGTDNESLVGPP